MCPDGTSWHQECSGDKDCTFADEICIMGKCCSGFSYYSFFFFMIVINLGS